jgi:hypothetical protein
MYHNSDKTDRVLQLIQLLLLAIITGGGSWLFHLVVSNNDTLITLKTATEERAQKLDTVIGAQKSIADSLRIYHDEATKGDFMLDKRVTILEGNILVLDKRLDSVEEKTKK